MVVAAIVTALAAGHVTFFLRKTFAMGPVEASAWVTLLAGIGFHLYGGTGVMLAAIATAVSYAAMSAWERIPGYGTMAYTSVVCGLVVYICPHILAGIGGRLGTMAAFSVLIVLGAKAALTPLRRAIKGTKERSQETPIQQQ